MASFMPAAPISKLPMLRHGQDFFLETARYAKSCHVDGAGRSAGIRRDFADQTTLDGRLPEKIPGDRTELRTNLIRGPADHFLSAFAAQFGDGIIFGRLSVEQFENRGRSGAAIRPSSRQRIRDGI